MEAAFEKALAQAREYGLQEFQKRLLRERIFVRFGREKSKPEMEKSCRFKAETNSLRFHAHNTTDYFDHLATWSIADMAIQFWLGLLSKRGPRVDSLNPADSRAAGTNLDYSRLAHQKEKLPVDQSQLVAGR
jgi:hypothetical protein